MARPLDEKRRAALVRAAVRVFATHGVAAPTSAVSKAARVSEGSLFTYFKTKDDLLEATYRTLRLELAAAILSDFPARGSIEERLRHVFVRWVGYSVDHPLERRALKNIGNAAIVERIRGQDAALFAAVDGILEDARAQKRLEHLPPALASAALKAMAYMTMDAIVADPDQRPALLEAGFRMLWKALQP